MPGNWPRPPADTPHSVTGMDAEFLHFLAQSVSGGEPAQAKELAQEVLARGIDPLQALQAGFLKGMDQVGRGFECGEMFLPDLVRAGAAVKAAVQVLEPELVRLGTAPETAGVVVLGTIQGDIHEIGKSLVGTMLTANGFQVHDLGVDVPPDRFVAKAGEVGADIVGVSSLLTTTMLRQRDVIAGLAEAGLRPQVKVLVGGAPVSAQWAKQIGADGYSEDAFGAVRVAREVLTR